MLLQRDMLLPWLCFVCRAQRVHARTKSSPTQQQVLLHFLISLRSGSVSAHTAPGSCRGLRDVAAGPVCPSKIYRGLCPSLPLPSIAVRCPAAAGRTRWCQPWSLLKRQRSQRTGQARSRGHAGKLGVNLKIPHLLEELWALHPWRDRPAARQRTWGKGAAEMSGRPQTS